MMSAKASARLNPPGGRPKPERPRARQRASRRGAFLVVVLVCLLVTGMLAGSLLKLVLLQDRQLCYEQSRLQAAWLAESGLDRASSRLGSDPSYRGETWEIDAARLGGAEAAVVAIRVTNEENRDTQRTVIVEAHFPAEGPHPARLTRQARITLAKEP
jgi:Tfp pilus assembly protein PilX